MHFNQFLNVGVDPKEIPLPHEFILNRDLLAQLYPSFAEGATPFFTLNWSKYADFLTFRGGLDPVSIAFFGIFIASFFYKPVFSSLQNLNLFNLFGRSHWFKSNSR